MSRIGKQLINLPSTVEVKINGSILIKGPKGELKQEIHSKVKVVKEENKIIVSVENPEEKKERALWGLFRSLINNMVKGVTEGFEKKLEIVGVGYKASVTGEKITLNVGYSHPVDFSLPKGITAKVEKNIITINGIDKQLVGEISAQIRKIRPPEPYKGKGIKYFGEIIRRKAGKAAKASSG